jgi:hypothetical protein
MFDDVLGVDDQHVTAALVAPERGIRHKQRPCVVLQEWDAYPSEITGQELTVCVLKACAHGERSGRGINSRCRVIERTLMRVSLIGLEGDFDRQLALDVGRANTTTSHVGADTKDVLYHLGSAAAERGRAESS